jgi:predicted transcriptional regulator
MPGRTISAHADERTAAKVAEMARLEDRTPSQIAAAALRFYVELPAAGRDAIRALEAGGDADALRDAAWTASRAVLAKRFDEAIERGVRSITRPDAFPDDEDGILSAAVQLTDR